MGVCVGVIASRELLLTDGNTGWVEEEGDILFAKIVFFFFACLAVAYVSVMVSH